MTLKEKIEDIVNDVDWHFIGKSEATSSLIQAFREILPEKEGCQEGEQYWMWNSLHNVFDYGEKIGFNSAIKIIEERLNE